MTFLKMTMTVLSMAAVSFAGAQASLGDPFEDLFARAKAFNNNPEGQSQKASMRKFAQSVGLYPEGGALAPVAPVPMPAVSCALTPPRPVDPTALGLILAPRLGEGDVLTFKVYALSVGDPLGPLSAIHFQKQ